MRAAVMLRYFEDMTEPEIAATIGIRLRMVGYHLIRQFISGKRAHANTVHTDPPGAVPGAPAAARS